MKGLTGQYMNEIVSLTILLLMTVALIAGQADATVHKTVQSNTPSAPATLVGKGEAAMHASILHADVAIHLDLERFVDVVIDDASRDAIRETINFRMKTND